MPAGSTYSTVATTTLGSATNLVTFSSISQAYTDLILVVNAAAASTQDMYFRLNGDGGSNYSWTNIFGTGSAAGSARTSNASGGMADYYGSPDTTLGNSNQILQFMNYSNTTTFKSILVRSNRANSGTDAIVNLWRSTAAITSIELRQSPAASINFSVGSTFTLYGIAAA